VVTNDRDQNGSHELCCTTAKTPRVKAAAPHIPQSGALSSKRQCTFVQLATDSFSPFPRN
jgi:hypothetical protein